MKTKITKKVNRTQQLRDKYESNRLLIQKELGLSEDDRFWFVIECGQLFLEEHYPSNDPQFSKFNKLHNSSSEFWDWFKAVWKRWESGYVKHKLSQNPDVEDYKSDFIQIAHDNHVHTSFQNTYLKTSSHGISN